MDHLRISPARAALLALSMLLVAALVGCSPGDQEAGRGGSTTAKEAPPPKPPPKLSERRNYVETGDLPALRERGKLRVLALRFDREEEFLPRSGTPQQEEIALAELFAEQQGIKPVLVVVPTYEELIDALVEGRGDLVAANLTITDERKERIDFTVPVDIVREQLIGRLDDDAVKRLKDLKGKTVWAQPATSYWGTLGGLEQRVGLKREALESDLGPQDILDRVVSGEIDYMVEDSNVIEAAQDYRQDFKVMVDLSGDRPVAWGLRQDSPELLDALNRFLNAHHLTSQQPDTVLGDLDAIRKRGALRMLTRNSGATYYLWRGELQGFEYELGKELAKSLGLRLEVVVPPSHDDLIPWLIEGRGDFIGAFLRPTPERLAQGVTFSRPYHYSEEMVVARSNDKLAELQDLARREIAVRRSSSYWDTLQQLPALGVKPRVKEAPADMETPQIIEAVADRDFDLTVADSHILELELTARDDVRGAFALTEPVAAAWVVRKQDTKLLAAINKFLDQTYRGTFYNITYRKYFENKRQILERREERIDLNPDGRLSPFDDIVQRYSEEYGFDWRLITAQMYQESRFDPKAKSWAGARGLLQILPRTAKQVGFGGEDLTDPDIGIHAGIKYLDWVRDRFDPELPVLDRMWFTLASYNAGVGHVRDARRLAARKGWDRNRWFGNVERAMLLLSDPKYYGKAAHGFVRGQEPVDYVQRINDRYNAYLNLLDGSRSASAMAR